MITIGSQSFERAFRLVITSGRKEWETLLGASSVENARKVAAHVAIEEAEVRRLDSLSVTLLSDAGEPYGVCQFKDGALTWAPAE